jgi:hypothetical protein
MKKKYLDETNKTIQSSVDKNETKMANKHQKLGNFVLTL